MIRSLLYFTMSHPNISFSVGACARYQANPKESHLISIKRIICYINGILEYSLWYSYNSSLMIIGYFDADWARNVEDRKIISTLLFYFFISDYILALLSKKQNFISLSTIKVEYVVVGSCVQLLWMRLILGDYGIEKRTMNIHYDNSSAINISKNLVLHSCTKHIEICHYFIKDFIEEKVVSLEFVPILDINWKKSLQNLWILLGLNFLRNPWAYA